MNNSLVKSIFVAADTCNAKTFTDFLSDDVVFRFGNAEVCIGKIAVEEALTGFFSAITKMNHKLEVIHKSEDVWTVEAVVNYVDNYGRDFSFQSCSIMKLRENKFCEYRIYIDNHSMFIPPENV